jgi:hypothetical protein
VYRDTHVENVLFLDRKIVDNEETRPSRKWVLEPKLDISKRHVFAELEEKMSEFFLMKFPTNENERKQRSKTSVKEKRQRG